MTVALLAAGLVAACHVSTLGVVLVPVALQLQLDRTSLPKRRAYPLAAGIGILDVLVNFGVAFAGDVLASLLSRRPHRE